MCNLIKEGLLSQDEKNLWVNALQPIINCFFFTKQNYVMITFFAESSFSVDKMAMGSLDRIYWFKM
jgi:hypothetical protein